MNEYIVITVIADDRPGLVDVLSRTIASHEGSWLESRMSRLAGKFAGVLRVEVASERSDELEKALRSLELAGFHIQLERSPDPGEVEAPRELLLELVGHDRPGILAAISQVLAREQVNVESLETERRNAPMSGERLFQARARLRVPVSVDEQDLRHALESIAGDLMVDIRVGSSKAD